MSARQTKIVSFYVSPKIAPAKSATISSLDELLVEIRGHLEQDVGRSIEHLSKGGHIADVVFKIQKNSPYLLVEAKWTEDDKAYEARQKAEEKQRKARQSAITAQKSQQRASDFATLRSLAKKHGIELIIPEKKTKRANNNSTVANTMHHEGIPAKS